MPYVLLAAGLVVCIALGLAWWSDHRDRRAGRPVPTAAQITESRRAARERAREARFQRRHGSAPDPRSGPGPSRRR